jgi:hypothetical protein
MTVILGKLRIAGAVVGSFPAYNSPAENTAGALS